MDLPKKLRSCIMSPQNTVPLVVWNICLTWPELCEGFISFLTSTNIIHCLRKHYFRPVIKYEAGFDVFTTKLKFIPLYPDERAVGLESIPVLSHCTGVLWSWEETWGSRVLSFLFSLMMTMNVFLMRCCSLELSCRTSWLTFRSCAEGRHAPEWVCSNRHLYKLII